MFYHLAEACRRGYTFMILRTIRLEASAEKF
jgi:hypothetical protein